MRCRDRGIRGAVREERGITGLETAIVLIAFVVVSSVFSFAALSSGLFSTDKAKETITAGLLEARGTIELRGSVIGEDTDEDGSMDMVYFHVSNAAGGAPVNLTPGETLIRYTDEDQTVMLGAGGFTVAGQGNADSDYLLEPGEMYQVTVLGLEATLNPDLGVRTTFNLQVMTPVGAVLFIERTTPVALSKYNDMN
jgi:archaeal flagellin FlaB